MSDQYKTKLAQLFRLMRFSLIDVFWSGKKILEKFLSSSSSTLIFLDNGQEKEGSWAKGLHDWSLLTNFVETQFRFKINFGTLDKANLTKNYLL